ncbi:MAG: hypothetical protein LQ337_003116 [Flavoplaca oasis]|nr:MAG: hypothetical protein LQ337_003116 [Flavoplaca oasis]
MTDKTKGKTIYGTIIKRVPKPTNSLRELAQRLVTEGPRKKEKTTRRVRVLFDDVYLVDSTSAYHVWEHDYYPYYYFPTSELKVDYVKREPIGDNDAVSFAMYKGPTKSTNTALMFTKGELKGLTRFDFDEMDAWFEEDQPIYQHPKDPYKRIDILPSTRKITIKVQDVVVADSSMNMFLFETMLRPRYYMPQTAVDWQYVKPSQKTTVCPYKGVAEYYDLVVNGNEIKDAVWWYRHPTRESALIEGMICFYNEKVDVYVDGEKEQS